MKPLVALKNYALNLLIGIDQLGNTIIGGSPDETISSRCARNYEKKWYWRWLGNFLMWLDADHLVTSIESEKYRKHFPDYFKMQVKLKAQAKKL